jgi:REP element-mobilizing transposase RayT
MPVYLITLHAYRSWREDHPRGYLQRGQPDVQAPSRRLAVYRDSRCRFPPVVWDSSQQLMLVQDTKEICRRRGWRLHGICTTPSHMHLVVSWRDAALSSRTVAATVKRILGLALRKQTGIESRRWFSRGAGDRMIRDEHHLNRLLSEYLPRHQEQNGTFWRESRQST